MKRTIIKIDENRCNGCGICVQGCHEGALQLINEKAVMVSELYCDGLGACIGECPVAAITLEEREAEPYNEKAVMERIVPKGEPVVLAHLKHLKDHGEKELLQQALDYLKKNNIRMELSELHRSKERLGCGCAGSTARSWDTPHSEKHAAPTFRPTHQAHPSLHTGNGISNAEQPSELRQFPIQLHLIHPQAPYFEGADVLLAADCTAFAAGNFHSKFLKGKKLAVACPKLDTNIEQYIEKLVSLIDEAKMDTLTVLIMEVPCCRGLVNIALNAREKASRNIPIKVAVLSVQGNIQSERWI